MVMDRFDCPNDPRSYVVGGSLPLVWTPKAESLFGLAIGGPKLRHGSFFQCAKLLLREPPQVSDASTPVRIGRTTQRDLTGRKNLKNLKLSSVSPTLRGHQGKSCWSGRMGWWFHFLRCGTRGSIQTRGIKLLSFHE